MPPVPITAAHCVRQQGGHAHLSRRVRRGVGTAMTAVIRVHIGCKNRTDKSLNIRSFPAAHRQGNASPACFRSALIHTAAGRHEHLLPNSQRRIVYPGRSGVRSGSGRLNACAGKRLPLLHRPTAYPRQPDKSSFADTVIIKGPARLVKAEQEKYAINLQFRHNHISIAYLLTLFLVA